MELHLESRMEGEFYGYDEDKIFLLVNGQKWQRARYKYRYQYRYRPRVKIFRGGGKYIMEVESIEETV